MQNTSSIMSCLAWQTEDRPFLKHLHNVWKKDSKMWTSLINMFYFNYTHAHTHTQICKICKLSYVNMYTYLAMSVIVSFTFKTELRIPVFYSHWYLLWKVFHIWKHKSENKKTLLICEQLSVETTSSCMELLYNVGRGEQLLDWWH